MARAESLRYLTKICLKGYSGAPNSIFKNKALLNLINGFSVIPPPSRPPATLIKSFWATLKGCCVLFLTMAVNCYGRAWKHTYIDLTASLFAAGRQGTFCFRFMQGRSETRPGTAKASQDSGDGFGRQEPQSHSRPDCRQQPSAAARLAGAGSALVLSRHKRLSLLLFVYFIVRFFCATCKGSKGTGGFVELGCFSPGQIMLSIPFFHFFLVFFEWGMGPSRQGKETWPACQNCNYS